MFTFLLLFAFSSINLSAANIRDGKYSDRTYGIEILVENGEATTAKVDELTIPLIKNGDEFCGDTTDNGLKYSFVVSKKTRGSLYTTVITERTIKKTSENQKYIFSGTGFEFIVTDGFIKNAKTGINKNAFSEIEMDEHGSIVMYNLTSPNNYSVHVENCEVINFFCNECKYYVVGSKNNIVQVYDTDSGLALMNFGEKKIELFKVFSGKQVISTDDGKSIAINTYFYENQKKLFEHSTLFSVDQDNVKFKTESKFILTKLF